MEQVEPMAGVFVLATEDEIVEALRHLLDAASLQALKGADQLQQRERRLPRQRLAAVSASLVPRQRFRERLEGVYLDSWQH